MSFAHLSQLVTGHSTSIQQVAARIHQSIQLVAGTLHSSQLVAGTLHSSQLVAGHSTFESASGRALYDQ